MDYPHSQEYVFGTASSLPTMIEGFTTMVANEGIEKEGRTY